MVYIREFRPPIAKEWNEYVFRHKNATFFHLTEWKDVVEETFGHRALYLYAENDGQISGILPLFLVDSRMFGRMLVSTAFAVYGGPVADRIETETLLIQRAEELGVELGVDYVELRRNSVTASSLPRTDLYVRFRQRLFDDPEENFKAMPREARRLVRKARKAGLSSEVSQTRLTEFYDIYQRNVKRLGTPVYPKKLFQNLMRRFGDRCNILSVLYQGKVIAAVMTFYFRDTVLPYYGGSLLKYNNNTYAPNNFMYWELMRYGIENEYKWFDFGRSKVGTGAYHFKKHFGMSPEPLDYQYILIRRQTLPNLNPMNPKYQLFIRIWKHLPLWMTRIIGPQVVRNIP